MQLVECDTPSSVVGTVASPRLWALPDLQVRFVHLLRVKATPPSILLDREQQAATEYCQSTKMCTVSLPCNAVRPVCACVCPMQYASPRSALEGLLSRSGV